MGGASVSIRRAPPFCHAGGDLLQGSAVRACQGAPTAKAPT